MSFSSKKASRSARQKKSLVGTEPLKAENEYRNGNSTGDINGIEEDVHHASGSYAPAEQGKTQSLQLLYSQMPPTLSIKESRDKGRGLWTKVAIPAGSVIFTAKPHAHVVSKKSMDKFCAQCGVSSEKEGLKKCTKCKSVHYCSEACQKADWVTHKLECAALIRWASNAPEGGGHGYDFSTPPDTVRCIGRLLWRRKKLGNDSIWWKEVEAMQSHRQEIAMDSAQTYVQLAHALTKYMGIENEGELATFGVTRVSDLVDICSKFISNCFTWMQPTLSPIGSAIIPFAALINHACDPNVSFCFPRSSGSKLQEPELNVIALQDLSENTELLTSYRDVTLPTKLRQDSLQETYFFTCKCSLCSPNDNAVEDLRTRLWCPRKCGGTCPFPSSGHETTRCSRCRAPVLNSAEIVDALQDCEADADKARENQFTDPSATLSLTRSSITRLTSMGVMPTAHPFLALLRVQQEVLLDLLSNHPSKTELDETIRIAASQCYALTLLLRFGHPVRAMALAELGKLLAVDEPVSSDSSNDSSTNALLESDVNVGVGVAGGITNTSLAYPPPYMRPGYPPSGASRLALAVQTLRQAYAESCIAFGNERGKEGGEVGLDLRATLVRLEQELAVWQERGRLALSDTIKRVKSD